ncbi:MAG: hypothetical protein ACLUNQ_01110 [Oscillospiraceae bacterium]
MDLIIGGAYQGKLDYARERFHLEAEDLAFMKTDMIPPGAASAIWSRRCMTRWRRGAPLSCPRCGRTPW